MQRLLVVLFILTVALCPLPLGSKRDWAWNPLAAMVGVLLMGTAVLALVDREWQRRAFAPLRALLVPAVLFGVVLLWGVVQVSGWTPASWASPVSAAAALGLPETSRVIAFDSAQQWTALLRLVTYAGVFALAATFGNHAVDARRLLAAIVAVATLTTLYSMAADAINSQWYYTRVLIWTPFHPYFSGSFLGANSYATYAGLSAMAALTLAFRPASHQGGREGAAERLRRWIAVLSGMSGVWLALAIILFMGVLMSGSRAGAASMVLALVTMIGFYSRGVTRVALIVLVPLTVLAVVVLAPGSDRLFEKTAQLLDSATDRVMLYQMTLGAIAARPMIGWGMNSFEALYGVFQPMGVDIAFEQAHDLYLELAFDVGIPVASALVVAVGWIGWRCAIGFAIRGRDRELAGLGVFATVLVGFHSLFDFSLQIPAVTCSYMAMLGVAWAQSWSSRQVQSD